MWTLIDFCIRFAILWAIVGWLIFGLPTIATALSG